MTYKLAVITDDKDAGAWVLARGINEIVERHSGNIDVDYIDKIDLKDLDDLEVLYVLGHGNPIEIHGGHNGKKLADKLLKQELPKNKKIRIRLLCCETGNYSIKEESKKIGQKMVKVRESLTRDLKNALTHAGYNSCTLEVPLGNVITLNAKQGEKVIDPNQTQTARQKYQALVDKYPKVKALNTSVQKKIGTGKDLLTIAKTVAVNKSVVDFFKEWTPFTGTVVYDPNKNKTGETGWRIVTT